MDLRIVELEKQLKQKEKISDEVEPGYMASIKQAISEGKNIPKETMEFYKETLYYIPDFFERQEVTKSLTIYLRKP